MSPIHDGVLNIRQNRSSHWYTVSLICDHSLKMMYTPEWNLLVWTPTSNNELKGAWCTAQKIISAYRVKQQSADRSSCAHSLKFKESFLPIVFSNGLQIWAHSWTILNVHYDRLLNLTESWISAWRSHRTRRTSQRLICADCVYQSQGLLIPVSKYYSTEVFYGSTYCRTCMYGGASNLLNTCTVWPPGSIIADWSSHLFHSVCMVK